MGSDCHADPRITGRTETQQMHAFGSQQVGWRGAITRDAAMVSGFSAALDDGEPSEEPGIITLDLWPAIVRYEELHWLKGTYLKKAAQRPIARIHLSNRQSRIECEWLRAA